MPSPEHGPAPSENPFDEKKRHFFSSLALEIRDALELHKQEGLWQRVGGKRDWGNVSEHCLVEAARVRALSEKFGLPETVSQSLLTAAGAHDFFKKSEKDIVTREGLRWDSFDAAAREAEQRLRDAKLSEETIRLVGSVGHTSLLETEGLLRKADLDDDDIAYLVMHYVDDYTVNAEWAQAADQTDAGARNDLDRRMDKNEANARYKLLDEEGRTYFNGETTFQAQRRIGHAVEERLAAVLSERSGEKIDPKQLPQVIDADVRARIESLESA